MDRRNPSEGRSTVDVVQTMAMPNVAELNVVHNMAGVALQKPTVEMYVELQKPQIQMKMYPDFYSLRRDAFLGSASAPTPQ